MLLVIFELFSGPRIAKLRIVELGIADVNFERWSVPAHTAFE
jgi:hypothetical protein